MTPYRSKFDHGHPWKAKGVIPTLANQMATNAFIYARRRQRLQEVTPKGRQGAWLQDMRAERVKCEDMIVTYANAIMRMEARRLVAELKAA